MTAADEPCVVIRRRWPGQVVAGLFVILGVVMPIVGLVEGGDGSSFMVGLVLGGVMVAFGLRQSMVSVRAVEQGLIVRNPLRTYRIPWQDVEGFRSGPLRPGTQGLIALLREAGTSPCMPRKTACRGGCRGRGSVNNGNSLTNSSDATSTETSADASIAHSSFHRSHAGRSWLPCGRHREPGPLARAGVHGTPQRVDHELRRG